MGQPAGSMVVGFDASPDAVRAVRWAAGLAACTGSGLRVCIARGDLYRLSQWADEWSRGLAEERAAAARALLGDFDSLDGDVETADGPPVPVLLDRSRSAEALVLGSRGHGRVSGVLLGSVSGHVARHAQCPVVVVRARHDDHSNTAYVGVDGSAASFGALEFALRVASARGLSVRAVYCPERPDLADAGDWLGDLPDVLERDLAARQQAVTQSVEEAGAGHPGVRLSLSVSHHSAARALVDASARAEMVAVGSHGRGAFAGLLLGSVSAAVLAHAQCPVAVVR